MPPDIAIGTVRAYHHGHGVPTYQAFKASLDFATARKEGLFVSRDCIDIRCVGRKRQIHTGFLDVHLEVLQQAFGVFRSPMLQHIVQRIEPFLRFYGVQLSNDVVLIYPLTHLCAFPCTVRSCSWLRIEVTVVLVVPCFNSIYINAIIQLRCPLSEHPQSSVVLLGSGVPFPRYHYRSIMRVILSPQASKEGALCSILK